MALYERFCTLHGYDLFPADEWQLARYAAFAAQQVVTQGTVQNYVSGVRTLQRLAGYQVPPTSSANIKLVMDGLKDELLNTSSGADTMTFQILKGISPQVNKQDPYQLCCYTSILVGFYLFLRKSNLVPDSHPKFDPTEQLTRSHVACDWPSKLLMVHIEWSKTDPHKQFDR